MHTRVHTLSVVAKKGDNGYAARLERRRSSRGAMQRILQLSGAATDVFQRQDNAAKQLWQDDAVEQLRQNDAVK
ncbi:unnamed protein product [Prunus armeniaca]